VQPTQVLVLKFASNSPSDTPQEDTDKFLAGFNGPFPTVTGYAGTEISSTVSLLYQTDWDVDYVGRAAEDWSSKCIDMLYRASDSKAKVVNFMVTHYWVDNNFDGKVGNRESAASVLGCVCWSAGCLNLQLCCTTVNLSQPPSSLRGSSAPMRRPCQVHGSAHACAVHLSNLPLHVHASTRMPCNSAGFGLPQVQLRPTPPSVQGTLLTDAGYDLDRAAGMNDPVYFRLV
jgi:hypothetical protein